MMVLMMPSAALIFENTRIWPSLQKTVHHHQFMPDIYVEGGSNSCRL